MFQPSMRTHLLFLILGLSASGPAFGEGLHHRMDCDKVLQLKIGQSPAAVRALIGEPWFQAPQASVWSKTGKPRSDTGMAYGNAGSSTPILQGFRDEMGLEFLDNRLVEVSAYRMHENGSTKKEVGSAILLGSRDFGNGPEPTSHEIGAIFSDFFQCGSGFSLARARAAFYVTSREDPKPAGSPVARLTQLGIGIGEYSGVAQDFADPLGTTVSPDPVEPVKFEISPGGALVISGSGAKTVIPWVSDRWTASIGEGRSVQGWPRRVGSIVIVEYFAFEGVKQVAAVRFYLTPDRH